MERKLVTLLITAAVAAALGLVVGGLIGHFATKSTDEPIVMSSDVIAKTHEQNRKFLLDNVSAKNLEDLLRLMSSKPHLAGSKQNNELGDMLEDKWKQYGFITKRNVYDVLLSYPGGPEDRNRAEILAANSSVIYTCQTEEKVLDPVQNNSEVIPPFNSFAKAGVVSSTRVYYVNYCRDEDFNLLTGNYSINVTEAIVVCRYGRIYRGNKVKLAEQHGAVGVIIYNDPADYVMTGVNATYEATFPNSYSLPPSGAQRGSADFIIAGDVLTPYLPSLDYVYRTSTEKLREDHKLSNIPTQPMGYEDAKVFLSQLSDIPDSVEVPEEWRGGISGLTYKFGGELADGRQMKIINNNKEERRNITNVFGIIKGSEEPDRYVLIGNHRDAWMFGAIDPLSGTTVLIEASRVYAELMKTGWRPRRTIIFCSWDAEEYGLVGSTEWVEDMKSVLSARSVAYLNCDTAVMYPDILSIWASPLLYQVLYDAAKQVPQPNRTDITLYDHWLTTSAVDGKPRIYDVAAGTDHVGFYHMLAIPSLAVGYSADRSKRGINDWYPLYHTTYETFKSMKLYVDPTFSYHKGVTQFLTEMVRDLADSVVIPFVTSDYATRLLQVSQQLDLRIRQKLETQNLQQSLDHLNEAVLKFTDAAKAFDHRASQVDTNSWDEVRRLNDQLLMLERSFAYDLGISNRPTMKHVVFAPSATNSYGSTAFAGIIDSLYKIDENDEAAWDVVKDELSKAIYCVYSATRVLTDEATNFW